MNVLQSNAPLIVYVDVKSPYAFVAIRPTLALEVELGMKFDWAASYPGYSQLPRLG